MKKKFFPAALMTLNFFSALAAFYSVSRAIKVEESSTWLVPVVWVSLFMLSIFLTAVFVKKIMTAEIVVACSLLTSLFFVFNLVHFAISVACIFTILAGIFAIRRDLDLNVKISLWKSLYLGKFRIVFAVAVLITSQYFFTIKTIDGPVNVPRIDLSQIAGPLITPILGIANPQFAEAAKQDLTVDEFIIQAQKDSVEDSFDSDLESIDLLEQNIPKELPPQQRELLKQQALEKMKQANSKVLEQNKQLVLNEGRRQFSKIAGRKVEGNEKVSFVFTGMINDKINNYFQPVTGGNQKSSFFPLVLSIILFATIWPLGSLLSNVWFLIVILLFKIFVRYGFVEIKKVTVEREMIS